MKLVRLLAVVLLSSLVASARAQGPASLFEAYRTRDFARFESELTSVSDFKPLLDEAQDAASSWPSDVAAAYLLEVSAAAVHAELFPRMIGEASGRPPSTLAYSGGPLHAPLRTNWQGLFQLAKASATRTPSTSAFSRAWARAAVALLEGADEIPPQSGAGLGFAGDILRRFLLSDGDRLDDESILIAKGSFYEARMATIVSYDLPTIADAVPSASANDPIQSAYRVTLATLDWAFDEGTKIFLAGEADPALRAEAATRWAALAIRRGRPGDVLAALSHLKLARSWNPDPAVLYVSWVLEGEARELTHDTGGATAAFKRAADLDPNGSAARLGLSAQLFLAGDARGARDLSESILNAHPDREDAWVLFGLDDYRHWSERVADLRGAVQ